tara:strand:+ start:943 stop:1077 length:135 start_codon:yes stop_codon:yes gene_type:complete
MKYLKTLNAKLKLLEIKLKTSGTLVCKLYLAFNYSNPILFFKNF